MSEYPTYSQRKTWNNDGMCPDWKPSDSAKDFWQAPYYIVAVLPKIEMTGRQILDSNCYPNKQKTKTYKKMQKEIYSVLQSYDPLKAYLEGVSEMIRTNDIYEGRVNIVGFKYNSIIVEAYVCLDKPK